MDLAGFARDIFCSGNYSAPQKKKNGFLNDGKFFLQFVTSPYEKMPSVDT